jgi:drug/metabolite transporter (DMT)-like permease
MLPAAATAALALTFVGPVGLVGCIVSDLPATLDQHPDGWRSLGYVSLLAVLSSALSLVLWNALLKRTSAVRASLVTYLMPIVAISWGLLDGEGISWGQLGMIGVILVGVYLVSASVDRRE